MGLALSFWGVEVPRFIRAGSAYGLLTAGADYKPEQRQTEQPGATPECRSKRSPGAHPAPPDRQHLGSFRQGLARLLAEVMRHRIKLVIFQVAKRRHPIRELGTIDDNFFERIA